MALTLQKMSEVRTDRFLDMAIDNLKKQMEYHWNTLDHLENGLKELEFLRANTFLEKESTNE